MAYANKRISFLGPSPSAISENNPKHINIYKLMQCFALNVFSENALVYGPAFRIYPGFTDKG